MRAPAPDDTRPMSFSNYYENLFGRVALGMANAGTISQAFSGVGSRYIALLNTSADNYPMMGGPQTGAEDFDAPAEKLSTILDLSTEVYWPSYERQVIEFEQYQQSFDGGMTYEDVPGRFTNSNDILFPVADGPVEFTHFAITTSTKADQADQVSDASRQADDGRILLWGSFTLQFNMQTYQPIPISLDAGDQLKIPAGSLNIYMS